MSLAWKEPETAVNWSAFLTALGVVFVAELGDKTQLAVVAQVCRFRRPWPVFAGASLGLALVTFLGAAVGQAFAFLVPVDVVRALAAGAFLVMGVLIGRQALKTSPTEVRVEECRTAGAAVLPEEEGGWCWHVFGGTLGLLFLAEMGDKTQLAVLSLAGQASSAGAVFLGGALALTGVTALGVLGGEALCRLIPASVLLWLSAATFIVVGALMVSGVL